LADVVSLIQSPSLQVPLIFYPFSPFLPAEAGHPAEAFLSRLCVFPHRIPHSFPGSTQYVRYKSRFFLPRLLPRPRLVPYIRNHRGLLYPLPISLAPVFAFNGKESRVTTKRLYDPFRHIAPRFSGESIHLLPGFCVLLSVIFGEVPLPKSSTRFRLLLVDF